MNSLSIGILGAGTWGTVLACLLNKNGHNVIVWSPIQKEIEQLSNEKKHVNLPDLVISEDIIFTSDIETACRKKDLIIFAVPSVFVRNTAKNAAQFINKEQIIVSVAKGLEAGTLFTMTQILQEELGYPDRIVALSGPTHAEEVAVSLPTLIVASGINKDALLFIQKVFSSDCFRVYTNGDCLGVELCGALKNIIALAAGISDGLGFGDNAKAAIITRGIAEITRLGIAMGCNPQTFSGLAGVGDLIVTATSRHSRNHSAGFFIGQGINAAEACRKVGMVVEGVNALEGAVALAERHNVEVPIISAVDQIINHNAPAKDSVMQLMCRKMKAEF